MPKLRNLSGEMFYTSCVTSASSSFRSVGAHVKVRRLAAGPVQTLTVPNHREID